MAEGEREEPRIGPFQVQVPPPSTNGSHVERASIFDGFKRVAAPLLVALFVSLTTVPRSSLLRASDLAYWWRVLIAVVVSGIASGLSPRKGASATLMTGAAVSIVGLFASFWVVRRQMHSHGPIVSELLVLAAWGVVAGGSAAVAMRAVRRQVKR